MPLIYHITTPGEWDAAQQQGCYTAPSLDTEGFIHCSQASQVEGVLQRYYRDVPHRLRLTIDTDKLNSKLQYDLAPSVNEAFPHVYGPINLEAVTAVEPV